MKKDDDVFLYLEAIIEELAGIRLAIEDLKNKKGDEE